MSNTDSRAPLAGTRVRVVGCFDSFLKAARPLAQMLESHGASISHELVFARVGQLSAEQRVAAGVPKGTRTLPMKWVVERFFRDRVDVVLAAHSGLRTSRLVKLVRAAADRRGVPAPIIVGFYPGVLFRMQLEGMMARSGCDLLLLNSRHDQALYRSAMSAQGRPDNSLLSGLSFLGTQRPAVDPAARFRVVFAAQPTVPPRRDQRLRTVELLAEAARRHPSLLWVIKPRHRKGETTLHRELYAYEDLFEELRDPPRNLVVDYTPLPRQFEEALCCITYSSTAAIESVVQGIPTRILTDLGVDESLGNHFFRESGMLGSIRDVGPGMDLRLEPAWQRDHLVTNEDLGDQFAAEVRQLLTARSA